MSKKSGSDVSPGTPDHFNNNSKSRTSMPGTGNRRIPLSNGRTPPSKWDDAERWIKSPVSGQDSGKGPRGDRQIKSKSGPLGGPGVMYSLNYSPSTPKVERRSFAEESPRGHGALVSRGLFANNGVARKFHSLDGKNTMSNSMPISLDEKLDNASKEDEPAPLKADDRRNLPAQMSHKETAHLSLKENLSFSSEPSLIPTINKNATKDKVWDIQVDKSVTSIPNLPKAQEPRNIIKKNNANSSKNASEASNSVSKSQREEEKITTWENLQKAKAEEAIQKLEMKLEKKRLTSTKKIMNKLKASQRTAEAMRRAVVSANDYSQQAHIMSRRRTFSCFNAKACSTCDSFFPCNKN